MVDKIPSNTLKNTVGSAKLSDDSKASLLQISAGGTDALEAFGDDTAFANAIYAQLGTELKLPSVSDITKGLFPLKSHFQGYGEISYVPVLKNIDLYERQSTVPEEYKDLQKMLINRFWGGRKFYVGDDLKWDKDLFFALRPSNK